MWEWVFPLPQKEIGTHGRQRRFIVYSNAIFGTSDSCKTETSKLTSPKHFGGVAMKTYLEKLKAQIEADPDSILRWRRYPGTGSTLLPLHRMLLYA